MTDDAREHERSTNLVARVFGRAKPTYRGVPRERPAEACTDHVLMPRWRGPQVMGDDARAMGFICHACGREYLPHEVAGRRPLRVPEPR